ncbi:MAG TPA: sigma factor, partial [Acidimicrobiales bacterium]|nr:sigma factor [Acidimicrobiales bacterium]
MEAEELFAAERPRLLGLAYRMVGSLSDAEDIVSEAWARWCARQGDALETPAAWLTTVTTRLAIDWLRRARHD